MTSLRIFYHAQLSAFWRSISHFATTRTALHLSLRSKAIIGELNERQATRSH